MHWKETVPTVPVEAQGLYQATALAVTIRAIDLMPQAIVPTSGEDKAATPTGVVSQELPDLVNHQHEQAAVVPRTGVRATHPAEVPAAIPIEVLPEAVPVVQERFAALAELLGHQVPLAVVVEVVAVVEVVVVEATNFTNEDFNPVIKTYPN